MKYRLLEKTGSVAEVLSGAQTVYSEWVDVGSIGGDSYSCQAVLDVDTPAADVVPSSAITFADDNWESENHGFSTGLKVQLTTSDTLPDPLQLLTDYFVIKVDDDNFKLANSLINANNGVPINLADSGVGNQTVTPVALAGGSIKLQQSNDGVNASDLGSATNITVDAVVFLEKDRPTSRYIRVAQTLTAGSITSDLNILVKGDKDV